MDNQQKKTSPQTNRREDRSGSVTGTIGEALGTVEGQSNTVVGAVGGPDPATVTSPGASGELGVGANDENDHSEASGENVPGGDYNVPVDDVIKAS